MAWSSSSPCNFLSSYNNAGDRHPSKSPFNPRFRIKKLTASAQKFASRILTDELNYTERFGSEFHEIMVFAAEQAEEGGDYQNLERGAKRALRNTKLYENLSPTKARAIRSRLRREIRLNFTCYEIEINKNSSYLDVIKAFNHYFILYRGRTIIEVLDQIVKMLVNEVSGLSYDESYQDFESSRNANPRLLDLETLIHCLARVTFWLFDESEFLESIKDDDTLNQTEEVTNATYCILAKHSNNVYFNSNKTIEYRYKFKKLSPKAVEAVPLVLQGSLESFSMRYNLDEEAKRAIQQIAPLIEVGADFNKLVYIALSHTPSYVEDGDWCYYQWKVIMYSITDIFGCDEFEISNETPFEDLKKAMTHFHIDFKNKSMLEILTQLNSRCVKSCELAEYKSKHSLIAEESIYSDLKAIRLNISNTVHWLYEDIEIPELILVELNKVEGE